MNQESDKLKLITIPEIRSALSRVITNKAIKVEEECHLGSIQ